MALSGAFSAERPFFLDPEIDVGRAALELLLKSKIVSWLGVKTDCKCHGLVFASLPEVYQPEGKVDVLCISHTGSGYLDLVQTFHSPESLVKFRLHKATAPKDYTALVGFEAIQELTRQGWTFETQRPSRKTPPYKSESAKRWYVQSGLVPTVHYLHALLNAEALFRYGLEELWHHQPAAYYKTILTCMKRCPSKMKDVRPWQTLDYYKLFKQRLKVGAVGAVQLDVDDGGGDFK